MQNLYGIDNTQLSTLQSQSSAKSEFNPHTWDNLAKWLHSKKEYKPEMLAEPEPLEAIKETYRVLNTPLSNLSVKQEIPPELTAALEQNTFIFSGFKTHHELVEASRLLKDKDGNFKPFQRYLNDIEKIDKTYNKTYLRAEYNYATASTQMAVKWKEWEQDGDDYDLQYRTAGDDRVREEHRVLNGTTLPPSDPFWNSYLPPNGWNCRCTTVQVRKGKYKQSNSEQAIARGNACTAKPKQQIFRFNPGKEMKVFPPKHPYGKVPEVVNNVVEDVFNKDHIQKAYAQADEFDKKSKAIADKLGVRVTDVNLKKEDRIIEKAIKDYEGNIASVKDIVRNTFVSQSDKIENVIEAISKEFEVIKITRHNTPEGYTGVLLNVKFNGIVMECQVNTPQMLYAKDNSYKVVLDKGTIEQLDNAAKQLGVEPGKGHGFYEKVRTLNDKIDETLINSIREESKEYYKKIRSIEIDTPQK